MAEGAWTPTASLMALLANLYRDPKKGRLAQPSDYMPKFGPQQPKPKATIDILRDMVPNCPPPEPTAPSPTT